PLQKLGGQSADWTTGDEAQRHLLTDRLSNGSLLPEYPITGECFGVRITLDPRLLHQAHGLLLLLPGMEARKRKPAPPHFVQKANRPIRLLAGPADQAIASVFFPSGQRCRLS